MVRGVKQAVGVWRYHTFDAITFVWNVRKNESLGVSAAAAKRRGAASARAVAATAAAARVVRTAALSLAALAGLAAAA